MIALTIQSSLNELVAFALTYLLHSSTWILLVLCLVKIPFFNTPLLKNYLWKGALIGGLLTSMLIHFSGNSLLEIHLGKEQIIQPAIKQQPTNIQVVSVEKIAVSTPIIEKSPIDNPPIINTNIVEGSQENTTALAIEEPSKTNRHSRPCIIEHPIKQTD